jgi:hypothetical protein
MAGRPSAPRERIAAAYALRRPLEAAEVARVVAALDELGARAAADAACEERIGQADVLAERTGIDRRGAVRSLLRASMQRIA